MDGTQTPRIALVTGAYRGIGYEVVRELLNKGFRVFLTARKRDAGKAAVKKLAAEGKKADFLLLDVSDPQSIHQAAQAFGKISDHLDVLINNAAIVGKWEKSILELSGPELEEVFHTNTTGPVLVTQAFLPYLRKSAAGRIIQVSSGAGSLSEPQTWAPAYSISKTALNAVMRHMSSTLAESGIAVNAVCPGWTRTDMGGPDAPRSVEQGADTIVWLAAEAPQNYSGQFLRDRQPAAW